MSEADEALAALPIDPTFPPSAYQRVSTLLRAGVIGFFILATIGMVSGLVRNPSATVGSLVSSNPSAEYGSVGTYLDHLFGLGGNAIILLGIFLMIAVTVGRVVYAAIDFYRGRERILAALSVTVVLLLVVGLFLVGPSIR